MEEARIHVDSQYLYWLVTGGVTFLFGIVMFWIKRWINQKDKQEEEWLKEGGLVTREKFYQWCGTQQVKCPALSSTDALATWRQNMGDKGGVLTKGEHSSLCKEIITEVGNHWADRIEELFDHHREWVGQELKIISTEQKSLNLLIKSQMETEDGRWSRHDEMKAPNVGQKT